MERNPFFTIAFHTPIILMGGKEMIVSLRTASVLSMDELFALGMFHRNISCVEKLATIH